MSTVGHLPMFLPPCAVCICKLRRRCQPSFNYIIPNRQVSAQPLHQRAVPLIVTSSSTFTYTNDDCSKSTIQYIMARITLTHSLLCATYSSLKNRIIF